MAHYMPPNMLALFAPRPPLEYAEPRPPKRSRPLTGVAAYISAFKDPATLEPLVKHETAPEKKARRAKRKIEKSAARILSQSKTWNPQENSEATEDAFKTLFVGRLDYKITEEDLLKEMLVCGPVKTVKIVKDKKTEKPRGYAFVEFEDEKDLRHAYKVLDGKKMMDRRVLVDVERGRTVPNWKPRRLGGGLGSSRKEKKKSGSGTAPPTSHRDSRSDRHRSSYDSRGDRFESRRDSDRRGERSRASYSDRDRHRGDRSRDRRDRDYDRRSSRDDGGDRDRGRDRSKSYSARDEKSSRRPSYDGPRNDDYPRSASDLPSNGPPLPPQSRIFG